MTNDNFKNWDRHDFIYMRNLLVSRLTLFNARRGGEPVRMLLSEFTEAQKGAWIDQQQVEGIDDPLEKELVDNMKLAYQSGKGSRRLLPVLFPKDTLPAVEKLIAVRKECGVADQNIFLFPNTRLSTDHVIGWNSIQSVAKLMGDKLEKPHQLIADKFRHRTSTLFALLEMPGEKREMFYQHMGHSEQMNRDVYQSPLAIREMTEVGSFLQHIDRRTRYETVHVRLDKCQNQEDVSTSQQAIERNTVKGTESPPYQDIVTEQQISGLQNCASTSGDANGAHSNDNGGDDDDCDDDLEECRESRYKRTSAFNKNTNKQRRYFKWSKAQAETVRGHFRAAICNNTMTGTKGALPSKKHIVTFLKETGIFQNIDIPESQKISLVKTKIFNERTKERALLEKLFD